MKYFLIAGEASGDLHASALMRELARQDARAEFAFLGGDLMADAAGHASVVDYRDMAYMGFVEVVKNLGKIRRNFKAARRAIDEFAPDRVVLIDYPSFNLKMAEHAKRRGIEVDYYISPKVWAWKSWRVRTIKRVVDKMLVIFPFEVDFYAQRGMTVDYVGNPSVEEVDAKLAAAPTREEFVKRNGLADKQLIALLPGSRLGEIRDNLPIMAQAARHCPQYRGVVAGAPGVSEEFYRGLTDLPVVFGQTFELLAVSRAAVVTSGTATLEAALAGVPQVAVYRSNGSKLAYKAMEKVLNVKYVTLPNLIMDEGIIPELLLHQCTAEAVFEALSGLLGNGSSRREQLEGYRRLRERLGAECAAREAARLIIGAASERADEQPDGVE